MPHAILLFIEIFYFISVLDTSDHTINYLDSKNAKFEDAVEL